MSVRYRVVNGRKLWGYEFELPGSTRADRKRAIKWGFKRKKGAKDAEAARITEEQKKAEAAARGLDVLPRTLGELMEEFLTQYVDKKLTEKTRENYREMIKKISAPLKQMPVKELTPLHFTREWNRLRAEGGRHLRTKAPRPLGAGSVALAKAVAQSTFKWAIGQGQADHNPVRDSILPRGEAKRPAVALTPRQQRLLIDASEHPDLLEVKAGLGLRRGEVLALYWTDFEDDEVTIQRSLIHTREGELKFKDTKTTTSYRVLTVPPSILAVLRRVRAKQDEFKKLFGPDYRDQGLVFSKPDGSPMRPDSLSVMVMNTRRRLKMPEGVKLHTFRHSHGSQLIKGGMELPTVSRRLGHSSTAVTARVYAHMLDGRDRAAAEVWEQLNTAERKAN